VIARYDEIHNSKYPSIISISISSKKRLSFNFVFYFCNFYFYLPSFNYFVSINIIRNMQSLMKNIVKKNVIVPKFRIIL